MFAVAAFTGLSPARPRRQVSLQRGKRRHAMREKSLWRRGPLLAGEVALEAPLARWRASPGERLPDPTQEAAVGLSVAGNARACVLGWAPKRSMSRIERSRRDEPEAPWPAHQDDQKADGEQQGKPHQTSPPSSKASLGLAGGMGRLRPGATPVGQRSLGAGPTVDSGPGAKKAITLSSGRTRALSAGGALTVGPRSHGTGEPCPCPATDPLLVGPLVGALLEPGLLKSNGQETGPEKADARRA